MAIFNYKAYNAIQQKISGQIAASSDGEAMDKLGQRGLTNIKVKTAGTSGNINALLKRVTNKDLVIFSRQFSVMVSANVSITEALLTLVEQTKNPYFQGIIADIAYDVDSGTSLSDAFSQKPKIFSDFFINIVRSGEASGRLDEVLSYLADQMERDYDVVQKVGGEMVYPAAILVCMVGVGVIFLVKVVPSLTEIMQQTATELPWSTKIIMATSFFFRDHLLLIGLIATALIIFLASIVRTKEGRYYFDTFKMTIPVFGPLFRNMYLVRFTRSFSTLLKGGVPLTKSLEIAGKVVKNKIYDNLIEKSLAEVNEGGSLSVSFENNRYVPKMVAQIISVGEKTGKIDEVLDRLTSFYEREIDVSIRIISTLLTPIVMIIIGIGVFIMVGGILLPMYQVADSMGS
ncbi:MAG: type II secretion system F family protein [Planctomycetes bacterium]|jgi:type IV pilus assembly protein PilC|nr:type II secretion system F family protein [Planctomycetota bacterium]